MENPVANTRGASRENTIQRERPATVLLPAGIEDDCRAHADVPHRGHATRSPCRLTTGPAGIYFNG